MFSYFSKYAWNNVLYVSHLMQVIRQDQENENLLAAKAKIAKNVRPRAALGDLGNKPAALTSKASFKKFPFNLY